MGDRVVLPRSALAHARDEIDADGSGDGGHSRAAKVRELVGAGASSHDAWAQYNYPNNWLLPKDPSRASTADAFASLAKRCEVRQDDPAWAVGRPASVRVGGAGIVLMAALLVIVANTLGLW